MTAFLTGRDVECVEVLTRAYNAATVRDDAAGGVRAAFWLGFVLQSVGEPAHAAGWMARARRLLDALGHDSVEHGYLLLPRALECAGAGDIEGARDAFAEAARIGERFGEVDLVHLGRQGCGRALLRLGDVDKGVALLDEVMVAVTAGELSPVVAGTVYCSVIAACLDRFDLARAREWTGALDRWCASQPEAVRFRGECLVYRAEILQWHGAWADAEAEAARACDYLGRRGDSHVAQAARYVIGEVHRLRGDLAGAERAYQEVRAVGRRAQAGLALVRLAQGRLDAATAAIAPALDDIRDSHARCRLLPAGVEVFLAAGETPAARVAAEELDAIARALGTPFVRGLAEQALGAVLLAEAGPPAALAALERAAAIWRDLSVPYEEARVGVLTGLAYRRLRDDEGAVAALTAAAAAFRHLGAAPDVARAEALVRPAAAETGGLTPRELDVLRLVATGLTNRAIAARLDISEKTVARHVSNILAKLDLRSRSQATAYAFQRRLV